MSFDSFFDKYIVTGWLFLRRFFIIRLIIYILRTWYMGLPALALWLLHRFAGWPLWPVWVALGAWLAVLFIRMLFVRIMFRAAGENDSAPPESPSNKNPYSSSARKAVPKGGENGGNNVIQPK